MLLNIFIIWIALSIAVTLFWLWGYYKKNPSVIDVGWSLCVLMAGSLFIILDNGFSNGNSLIIAYWILLSIWSLRLCLYIYSTRIKVNKVDQRYLDLSKKWSINVSLGYFFHYQIQAFLMLIVSLPFFYIARIKFKGFESIDFLIISCILLSIFAESVSDYQLYEHKKKKSGELCDRGLWNFSRHPNYFFEWLIWLGFSFAAIEVPFGYLSLLSPCLLLYLFLFVTGPITEKTAIKSKSEAYKKYQKTTSMFVPWFKRKT